MKDPRLVSGVALAEFLLPALLFTLSPADSPSTHYFLQAAPLNPVPFCSRLDSDSSFGPLVPAQGFMQRGFLQPSPQVLRLAGQKLLSLILKMRLWRLRDTVGPIQDTQHVEGSGVKTSGI